MNKTITLIRHGITSWNLEKRYLGRTDQPLLKEEKKRIARLNYPDTDIVFSSPLIRCIETASIIYPNHRIHIIDDLIETDFGLFEGMNYQELSDFSLYQEWIDSNGKAPFPEGESFDHALQRSFNGFKKAISEAEDARRISIICHGGTIMAIISQLFGGDYYSYHVENGEGYSFDLSHNGLYSGLHPRSFNR